MVLVRSPSFLWGEQLLQSLDPIHRHSGEQICQWFLLQSQYHLRRQTSCFPTGTVFSNLSKGLLFLFIAACVSIILSQSFRSRIVASLIRLFQPMSLYHLVYVHILVVCNSVTSQTVVFSFKLFYARLNFVTLNLH